MTSADQRTTRRVRVLYFAMLREQAGCAEETVGTAADTAAELYDELGKRHRFALRRADLRVAVNGDLVGWEAPLGDGAEVVFLPPFAGG